MEMTDDRGVPSIGWNQLTIRVCDEFVSVRHDAGDVGMNWITVSESLPPPGIGVIAVVQTPRPA